MSLSKPTVVFALAERSWASWLPPFLLHETFVTRTQWIDSDWQTVVDDLGTGADVLVPLSLHDTLLTRARAIAELPPWRRDWIIHPSEEVALLAHDKRQMAKLAVTVPGCQPIPEFDQSEAEERLAHGDVSAIVVKAIDTTEGRGLRVCSTVNELRAVHPNLSKYLLQQFVQGLEYSINLVCRGGECLPFEPVFKGPTSRAGVHPCRRLRFCPCPTLVPAIRERLVNVAISFARTIGVEGLVEIELILADGDIFFLEVNPRLSATMRMASVACDRSIFTEVPLSRLAPDWPGAPPRSVLFTAELPLPCGTEVESLAGIGFPVWISSRVTTAATDTVGLTRQLRELASRLGLTGLLMELDRAQA